MSGLRRPPIMLGGDHSIGFPAGGIADLTSNASASSISTAISTSGKGSDERMHHAGYWATNLPNVSATTSCNSASAAGRFPLWRRRGEEAGTNVLTISDIEQMAGEGGGVAPNSLP